MSESTQQRETKQIVLLSNFNLAHHADLAVAILQSHDIAAEVFNNSASSLTPFTEGNHRVFVPKDRYEEAVIILNNAKKEGSFLEDLATSSSNEAQAKEIKYAAFVTLVVIISAILFMRVFSI